MAIKKTVTVTVTKDNNFLIYLGIFFIILKLTGIIEWSWWLVLLPIWIFPAIAVFFIFIGFLILIIFNAY